jgi:hypothetical protein
VYWYLLHRGRTAGVPAATIATFPLSASTEVRATTCAANGVDAIKRAKCYLGAIRRTRHGEEELGFRWLQ